MTSRFQVLKLPVAALAAAIIAGPAVAAQDQSSRPAEIDALYACRAIADTDERLTCYDARVAELVAAEQQRDVLIVDRETVQQRRQENFGIRSSSDEFSDLEEDDKGLRSITSTILTYRDYQTTWVIVLADGSQWVPTEGKRRPLKFKEDAEIAIQRGPFGSYKAKVDGTASVRVRRVR